MGFWDVVTDLIPGGIDDAIVGMFRSPSGSDPRASAQALLANTGGDAPMTPQLPAPSTNGTYDEGWIPGKQFYDPGEWIQDVGPVTNVPATAGNCPTIPVTVTPTYGQVAKAPPGYVIVRCRNGQKVAMLKEVARRYGFWKPRRKPPIKVSDWQALMKSERVIKKLKTVQKRAGMVQRARGRTSRR